jgi:hydroxyacylglutathione hydrolase
MILHRIVEPALAQVGYLVGCPVTREALAVDPTRDTAPFLAAAAALDLHITAVTETHIHADFVSGARALAAQTGAQLYLSAEGADDWRYCYARDAHAVLLHDRDRIHVGEITVDVRHTPGHTPEHLSFLVTPPGAGAPTAMLTGDFLFVNDVGRPDLLERAAGVAGSADAGARQLYKSLRGLQALPDTLPIWPGHTAGSVCGKALGSAASTTLGAQRLTSWAFDALREGEDRFVARALEDQPAPPAYFARMKRVNRDAAPPDPFVAPTLSHEMPPPGALVIDLRPADAFAAAPLPGALNIPLDRSFATWAGALIAPERELALVVPEGCTNCAGEASRVLALVGIENVMIANYPAGIPTASDTIPQYTPDEVAAGTLFILDVRNDGEWSAGHLPGAHHIPLAALPERLGELPHDRAIAVHCQGGARSAIATSFLRAAGFTDAANLAGGLDAWQRGGHPVVRGE